MNLLTLNDNELYPTEQLGPKVLGTMMYKMGDETAFETAYIPTNERLIMNANMHAELYQRVFSYEDVASITFEMESIVIEFTNGMKIPMVNIIEGDAQSFVEYVKKQLQ